MTLNLYDYRKVNTSTGDYLTRTFNIDPPSSRLMPGISCYKDSSERLGRGPDCDEVFPGIIVGNGPTVKNLAYLQRIGITHVLNAAENDVTLNPTKLKKLNIRYLGFRCPDLPQEDISAHFHRAAEFIDLALSFTGSKVFVNCLLGHSRSATIVAAYLMLKKNYSAAEALQMMRGTRDVRPNIGFLQQLGKLDDKLRRERNRRYY